MTAYTGNAFDLKTGLLEGDQLAFMANIGIHRFVERANNQTAGYERKLTTNDLPAKVRVLVTKAEALAEQLLKCGAVPVSMAADYLKAQIKVAAEALPVLVSVLQTNEQVAREAVDELRKTLIGKTNNSIIAAAVDGILQKNDAVYIAERAAALPFWKSAFGICRDVANSKASPRWLVLLTAEHEAHRVKQAATG
ncbi:MAG: hypothetical protein WCL16_07280 [bacterium]